MKMKINLKKLTKGFSLLELVLVLAIVGVLVGLLLPKGFDALRSSRVRQVQEILERPLILENPSSYLQFRSSTMDEWAFLAELCERADCGLLLDVNNVYVSAKNHGYAWQTYLAAVPWERVCQFHVAGHTTLATHLFDSHIGPVDPPVWDVLRAAFSACGGRSLLLEWDFEIPDFAETAAEAARAWSTVADLHQPLPRAPTATPEVVPAAQTLGSLAAPVALQALQRWMVDAITDTGEGHGAVDWIVAEGALTPEARIAIHTAMYAARVDDALREDFPVLRAYLGDEVFDACITRYRRDEPSTHWALEHVGRKLAIWLGNQPDVPAPAVDVARLERARVEALLAPTSPPFDARVLAGLSADDHEQLALHFAPGTQLLSLAHAVAGLWQEGRLRPGPQTVLIFPQGSAVIQRIPTFAEAALLRPLLAGTTLGDAMTEVAAADPEGADELPLHVGAWFADWAATGLVVRVHVVPSGGPSGCR